MADLNEVRLIGRLTRDPELRTTPNGQSVATFGIATGRKYKGQDGVQREETTFVDITCWSRLAENVHKYLRKGKLAFVAGRLNLDTWEDRQTGQKRSKMSVVADNVQFLDRAGSERVQNMQPPQVPSFPQNSSWDEPNMGEPPF
jgi:single-strand DNA-binding protein